MNSYQDKNEASEMHLEILRFFRNNPNYVHVIQEKLQSEEKALFCLICKIPSMSVTKLAAKFGVNKSTISRRIKNKINPALHQVFNGTKFLSQLKVETSTRPGVFFYCPGFQLAWVQEELQKLERQGRGFLSNEQDTQRELIGVLDGMTWNRVGEIIFQTDERWTQLLEQPEAYRKCLEDFSFAVVFFDTLGVLEPIAQSDPATDTRNYYARQLIREVHAKNVSQKISEVGCPYDLTTFAHEHSCYIRLDIQRLADAPRGPWLALIQREVNRGIGLDASLFQESLHCSNYKFHEGRYIYHKVLCDQIPSSVLKWGLPVVKQFRSDITQGAAEAFLRRMLLNHIAIGWHYITLTGTHAKFKVFRDYLPCATRANLIRPVICEDIRDRYRFISRVQDLLLPYCLARVLKVSHKPDEFLQKLYELRDVYEEPKNWLKILREQMYLGNNKAVKELIQELTMAVNRLADPLLTSRVEIFDKFPDRARWVQELTAGIDQKQLAEVDSKLAQFFPHTFSFDASP